jgi:tetratricopeptide (TPR) repeat protein
MRDTFGFMLSGGPVALAILSAVCTYAFQLSDARQSFEEARRYFESRQWDKAETAAGKALAADPRMGDAETLLGLIATVRSHFPEAEKHFARAVALEPRNYQALGYLGSTYLQEKRLSDAAGVFKKVLELNPGNLTAHHNLGLIALAEGSPAEALPQFQAVVRANNSDVPALMGILESQFALRQSEDARRTAQRLQALVDDRDPRLVQIAALLAQNGQAADAIPMMERAQRAHPQSFEVSYNLALACLQTAQYDRAIQALQPFVGGEGKAEAFDLLGTIEEKRPSPQNAERAFEEAAHREPGNEDYRFDFGNSLLQHGKPDLAVVAFRQAVSDLPKSWRLRIGLGSACYLAGDYEGAAEALLEAVRLKPDASAAYFLLGEAYDSAPRFQPAIETAFAGYLKNAPQDAWACYHYAVILYTRAQAEGGRDCPEAVRNLNQALRLNSNFAEAYYELGLIALAEKKYEQGIASLEKAISLNPQLAAAHYRLGLAYQRMGNAAHAKEELDKFRALKNDAPYRAQVLESMAGMSR